jgi:hypothetical protein
LELFRLAGQHPVELPIPGRRLVSQRSEFLGRLPLGLPNLFERGHLVRLELGIHGVNRSGEFGRLRLEPADGDREPDRVPGQPEPAAEERDPHHRRPASLGGPS